MAARRGIRATRSASAPVNAVEEILGWLKTIALLRKTRHRGVRRVAWMFTFATAVYKLVRIRNLTWAEART